MPVNGQFNPNDPSTWPPGYVSAGVPNSAAIMPGPFAGVTQDQVYQMLAPRSAADIYAELARAEQFLPSQIQIGAAGGDPAAVNRARANYVAQHVNPVVAQAKADAMRSGADHGSFAGGLIGALQSEGNRNAETAAQELADRQMARWEAQRNGFFGQMGSVLGDQTNRAQLFGGAFGNNRSFGQGQRTLSGGGNNGWRLGNYLQAGFGTLHELAPYLKPTWNGMKGLFGGLSGKTPIGTPTGQDEPLNNGYHSL